MLNLHLAGLDRQQCPASYFSLSIPGISFLASSWWFQNHPFEKNEKYENWIMKLQSPGWKFQKNV